MKKNIETGTVYLVKFETTKNGHEIYGNHYAVALTKPNNNDSTLLVAPITGKKEKKKYKGGITLNNHKYQKNPKYEKCFVYLRKIKEIDINKIIFKKEKIKDENGKVLFNRIYTEIFSLDSEDTIKLKRTLSNILSLNNIDSDKLTKLKESDKVIQLKEEGNKSEQGKSV